MQIYTTDTPAKAIGQHISESIQSHDGDVLCLLSGGSALDIVQYIKVPDKSECRAPRALPTAPPKERTPRVLLTAPPKERTPRVLLTAPPKERTEGDNVNTNEESECRTILFIMGDERVSGETEINNYLQLKHRYAGHQITDLTIDTSIEENELVENFATRIEKVFLKTFSELKNPKVISILGMGTDGHTAGIFPMDQESFQSTYREDGMYVPVHVESLKIDSRASITPTLILNRINEIFAYVVGNSKNMMLESLIYETKELHERPAELLKLHDNVHLYTDQFIEPK